MYRKTIFEWYPTPAIRDDNQRLHFVSLTSPLDLRLQEAVGEVLASSSLGYREGQTREVAI